MRILMISDFYRSVAGGIEMLVRNLGQELSDRGHDVAVAAIAQDGFPEFELDGAIRVYRLQTSAQRLRSLHSNVNMPAAPPFPDPEAIIGLRRVVDLERPEVVHGHDWLARSFLPLRRRTQAPLVMSLHYYTLACAKKDLIRGGLRCTGPRAAKCVDCAVRHYGPAKGLPVVLGNFGARVAERRLVDMYLPVSFATAVGNSLPGSGLPFEVIPNFLPSRHAGGEAFAESHLSQLPEERFLLFVGDLGWHKGVDVLLDTYSSLETAPPLVLIGRTPRPDLRLPRNVVLLTKWPHEAVQEAHRRSLAVIVPSRWAEPFGIVLLEAMAAGRPVVASRVGGIPEIVQHGTTGVLVPPGDPVALRDAIDRLLADPEYAKRLGDEALVSVESFSASAVVPKFERVYSRLLARVTPTAR